MKTSRFFLGGILLFWGWQTDTIWIALCLGTVLESAYFTKTRFEFKPLDFNKFVDISIMLLAGTIVLALTIDAQKALMILLRWLPIIFFPIIAAQQYSAEGKIDIQSFFLMTRKRLQQQYYETKKINISYIFALFCILSAGTANIQGPHFFIGTCFFSVWALWQNRSRRYGLIVWLICIATMIVCAHTLQGSIRSNGVKLAHWVMERYVRYYSTNPFKNYTAMGDIGQLKLSDKIILRASLKDHSPGTNILLHRATYNKFILSNWTARIPFTAVEPQKDKNFWPINTYRPRIGNPAPRQMVIYSRPVKNKEVLSLPAGVISIDQMKAGSCEKNSLQAIRIEDLPGLVKTLISFTGKPSFDAPPEKTDLFIPKKELPGITKIANSLLLEGKSDPAVLAIVKHYFLTQFNYSLDLEGKGRNKTALQKFLFHTKSGHCEFFATSTALILRQAKIPTRYATGYIAHEFSKLGNHMIVRQRDAHAWTKAYINGQWIDFDTTPPSFLQIDRQTVSTSWINDSASFFVFKLLQIKHETDKELMERYGLWLILPLGLILFFRLKKKSTIKRFKPLKDRFKQKDNITCDDAFLKFEKSMSQKGFARYPFETWLSWFKRIEPRLEAKDSNAYLKKIQNLYYCHRFSKNGLTMDQEQDTGTRLKTFLNIL